MESSVVQLTPWQKIGDNDAKLKFAALLRTRPNNIPGQFEAARLLYPDPADQNIVMIISERWPSDPVVIAEMERLNALETKEALPTREQQARDIYNLTRDTTVKVDERLKAHKLYAEIMGFVTKPTEGNTQNNYVDNRVVYFPMIPQTEEEIAQWDSETKAQQARLVGGNASGS